MKTMNKLVFIALISLSWSTLANFSRITCHEMVPGKGPFIVYEQKTWIPSDYSQVKSIKIFNNSLSKRDLRIRFVKNDDFINSRYSSIKPNEYFYTKVPLNQFSTIDVMKEPINGNFNAGNAEFCLQYVY